MDIKGTLSINRRSDGKIAIEVGDYVSGLPVLQVSLTAEQFGNAVTGLYLGVDNTARVWFNDGGARFFGCKCEHKDVLIAVPSLPFDKAERSSIIDAICAQYEVDGWQLSRDDFTNSHRRADSGQQRVGARRYVDEHGEPVLHEETLAVLEAGE